MTTPKVKSRTQMRMEKLMEAEGPKVKPKEFWIHGYKIGPHENCSQLVDVDLIERKDGIHVIEKSAYDKLKAENAQLKKEAAEMFRMLNGGG